MLTLKTMTLNDLACGEVSSLHGDDHDRYDCSPLTDSFSTYVRSSAFHFFDA